MPSWTDDRTVGDDVREHEAHEGRGDIQKRPSKTELLRSERSDGGSVCGRGEWCCMFSSLGVPVRNCIYSSKCNTHFLRILEAVEMRRMTDGPWDEMWCWQQW